jgi:hypothetical protein
VLLGQVPETGVESPNSAEGRFDGLCVPPIADPGIDCLSDQGCHRTAGSRGTLAKRGELLIGQLCQDPFHAVDDIMRRQFRLQTRWYLTPRGRTISMCVVANFAQDHAHASR